MYDLHRQRSESKGARIFASSFTKYHRTGDCGFRRVLLKKRSAKVKVVKNQLSSFFLARNVLDINLRHSGDWSLLGEGTITTISYSNMILFQGLYLEVGIMEKTHRLLVTQTPSTLIRQRSFSWHSPETKKKEKQSISGTKFILRICSN